MNAVGHVLRGILRELWKTLKLLAQNKAGFLGFILTLLIVLLSFVGPTIWPAESSADVEAINQGVSSQHWLGTDFQGQDNLRKVINGGKDIITVAFLTGVSAPSRPGHDHRIERQCDALRVDGAARLGRVVAPSAEPGSLAQKARLY
jgi:hypothetical protein